MGRPVMRRLAPLVLALVSVLVAHPEASSAQESPSVRLTLLSQTTWNSDFDATHDRELVVRFRAENLGSTALERLSIGMTLYSRVLSRSAYENSLVADPPLVIDAQTVPREGALEEGDVRDFEISLTLGSGIDPDHSGVYPLKVDLRSGFISIAVLRTPAIFLVRKPEVPLGLSWTFVLAHPITFAPDGTFTNPSLEEALAPDGELSGQIRALLELSADPAEPPFDLALSPVLLTQLGRMRNGYEVAEGEQIRTVPAGGGGAASAAHALDDLRTIANAPNVEVSALPFSTPEIPALLGGGLGRDLATQLQRGRDVVTAFTGTPMTPGILRPPGAALDDEAIRGLPAMGIDTVIVGPSTVDLPEQPLGFAGPPSTSMGDGSLTAIVPDPASDAVLGSVGREDPVMAAQVLLGELTTIWQERPGEPRGIAIVLNEEASFPGSFFGPLVRGIATAPWLDPATAEGLVDSFPPGQTSELSSPSLRRFPPAYVASLKQARRRIDTLRSMLPTSSDEPDRLDTLLLLAEAQQFLISSDAGLAFIDAARSGVRTIADDLALDTVSPITLTSESGGIPVTIANDGVHTLRLSVRLVSQWIRETPSADLKLGPGGSETLRLQAELRSTGRFPVLVQMVSPSGRVIGEEAIVVRSTAYNRIALVITIGAALVLLLVWARRFVPRGTT